jgi:hypothetical protein
MTEVGKSDWEGTFAGTLGNGEDAPENEPAPSRASGFLLRRLSDAGPIPGRSFAAAGIRNPSRKQSFEG